MSVERLTVQLEQLQDTIDEQNRLVLLELDPSESEKEQVLELARTCREGVQTLGSSTLGAEYTRLLGQLRELPVNTAGLELDPPKERPPRERSDGKKVRFSEVRQEFEPEVPYTDNPDEIVPVKSQSLQSHYDYNNTLMMEQDVRLETLGQSVRRTHSIGTDINQELDVHIQTLSDLESQTDAAQDRLSGATTRVTTFNQKAREGGSCLVITILTLMLFIMLVLL